MKINTSYVAITEEEAALYKPLILVAGCLIIGLATLAVFFIDPKNDEGLRNILTPIFINFNEKQRQELFDNIQLCTTGELYST